jgi:flagellar hook-associated protein 1 FlgK
MGNLFSALTSATRSLEAQRFGLDATGQNIANVNTPGYSRRTVDFASVPPETPYGVGRGVEVAGIRAQRDRLTERRLQQETSGAERYAVIADSLSVLEATLGTTSDSLDTRLHAFFDSWSRLAESPTAAVARQDVVLQATTLAASFNGLANRLGEFARDADRRISTTVDEINQITRRIAVINNALGDAGATGPGLHLQDEQAALVKQLSALTEITVVQRPDGGVDIDSSTGHALVVGKSAFAMTAAATAPNGHLEVSIGGANVTQLLTGARLGGLLQVRDVHIPEYAQALDEQAAALADAVNAAHSAGFDLDGNNGVAFFDYSSPVVGTTGAAAALRVNPAVAANHRRVVAASVAQPGDNQAARELADIRNALIMDGGTATLTDSWGQFVYRIGRDVQTATSETTLRKQVVMQVEALRDQVSGVSLDEEALNLMKFQRAYEANARFFQVIDSALTTLFEMVRR